jgi:O-antigen ligase
MKAHAPLVLLAISAFLAPLMGGYVLVETLPLEGGIAALLASLTSPTAPAFAHAVISLFFLAGFGLLLATSMVIQTPSTRLGMALGLLLGLLLISFAPSSFKFVSTASFAHWLIYVLGFFAAVALSGRRHGPKIVTLAIFAGVFVVALLGVREYAEMKAIDPSWRVFSTWMNPNALAGILIIGLLLGLGHLILLPRLGAVAAGAGVIVIGLALLLTQSRGGYLAAIVGIAFYGALLVLWGRPQLKMGGVRIGICLAAIVLMSFGLRAAPGAPGGTGAMTRIQQPAGTQEQSAGFRRLLWHGSVELMRSNPVGYGIGTYRYESSRPALTTPTHFAHNSYLQLGVEAGILAPALLLIFGGLWLFEAFRGARRLPTELNLIRAGIVAAIAGTAAHSVVESNLYHFGIGFCFFLLLGLSLMVSADSVTPELLPKPFRYFGVLIVILGLGQIAYHGYVEIIKARLMHEMREQNVAAARPLSEQAARLAPADGEIYYLQSLLQSPGPERIDLLEQAVTHTPSARHFRALARELAAGGEEGAAWAALRRALRRDPYSLPTLRQLLDLQVEAGNESAAAQTADFMVRIEETTYFQIRALPEVIPTQTFYARLYLASIEDNLNRRAELLDQAVQGFGRYRTTTLPRVLQVGGDFAGETPSSARGHMGIATSAARQLAALYRDLGDEAGAAAAEAEASAFAEAAGA